MANQDNMVSTLKYVQQKKFNTKALQQELIALAFFVVSLLVVIFVYLPIIKKTNEFVSKYETTVEEVKKLKEKYLIINAQEEAELQSQLELSKRYIPDDIRVAELATFINKKAQEYNLKVSRLGISEEKTEVNKPANEKERAKLIGTERQVLPIYLGRIEGPFGFTGKRVDLFKFLDFLVKGGYATHFDKVTIMLISEKEDVWGVNFTTSYYYLQPLKNVDPKTPLVKIDESLLPKEKDIPSVTPSATILPTVTPSN